LNTIHWAIAAVYPLLIGLLLWLSRRAAFRAVFTEDCLIVETPQYVSIPYRTLEGLRGSGVADLANVPKTRPFPIQIWHEAGALEIPARLNVPSADVYDFLIRRLACSGSRDINSALLDYLQRQEQSFGTDRVLSYRARRHLRGSRANYRVRAFFLALLLSGISWVIIATVKHDLIGWLGPGVPAIFFGGLVYLHSRLGPPDTPRGVKNWRSASLVIAPVGIAMVQGEIQGELPWSELLQVQLINKKHVSFELSSATPRPSIMLRVEGARIHVADIYDRPLIIIYQNILRYWRQTADNSGS
jgi:hypothetical protein